MTQTDNRSNGRASWRQLLWTLLSIAGLPACSITSPYWDYVPASTSTPIPFQVFSISNANLQVECANDTNAHGNPANGEASYIWASNLTASSEPSLDSLGNRLYSFSKNVTLPSACWEYFSDWDFWQANVRVVYVNSDGTKVPYSSYDRLGLECLGREVGKAASWFGAVNKGCEKRYLNSTDVIPYIVMRIEGYAAGTASAARSSVSTSASAARIVKFTDKAGAAVRGAPAANSVMPGTKAMTPAKPFSNEMVKQAEERQRR